MIMDKRRGGIGIDKARGRETSRAAARQSYDNGCQNAMTHPHYSVAGEGTLLDETFCKYDDLFHKRFVARYLSSMNWACQF